MNEDVNCLHCEFSCKPKLISFNIKEHRFMGQGYECPICSETFATDEQMDVLLDQYWQMFPKSPSVGIEPTTN